MNICVYNRTKENVAKALGVAKAQKKLKVRYQTKTRDSSVGNPYIMLGRKVNSKGKMVK